MLANGVKETTTTTGTGTVTLAAVTGRVRFSQAFPVVGSLVHYAIKNGDNWEWGIGKTAATNTMERTIILSTLVAGTYTTIGAAALTLAGASDVFCADIAESRVSAIPAANSGYITSGHDAAAGASSAVVLVANRLYLTPFRLDHENSITGLSASVSTAVASTKFRLGLYAVLSTGLPGALLAQTADLLSDTTGNKLGTITQTRYPPGWYFVGLLCNGAPTVISNSYQYHTETPLGNGNATGYLWAYNYAYAAITAGWTVLPDPAPAVSLVSNQHSPRVLMQVAA